MMKQCKICGTEFELSGFQDYCSESCFLERTSPTKKENRITSVKLHQLRKPENYLLKAAKQRAKQKQLPFDLEVSDIIIPEYCPILNIKLISNINSGRTAQESPSLDKIDPTLGYVKGNVWVISALANRMKQDATVEQLKMFAENIHKVWER